MRCAKLKPAIMTVLILINYDYDVESANFKWRKGLSSSG